MHLDDQTLARLENAAAPQSRASSPLLTIAIIVLTVLTPVAEFFWLRLHGRGPTVIESLGMPWPGAVSDVVQTLSAAVVGLTLILAVVGILSGSRARIAGIVSIAVAVLSAFPVLVLTLILTFGDPAP